jgi:uncharacterized membrane protein YjjP (DUF1212 family)
MILGMWVNTLIAYYLNSYYSGKFISYSTNEQLRDIMPSFFLALSMGVIVFFLGKFIVTSYILKFVLQIISGILITLVASEIFKPEPYMYIKDVAVDKIKILKHGKE